MTKMLYLLQSILVKKGVPAIYLGTNAEKKHLCLIEADDAPGFRTIEQEGFSGMDWVRLNDPKSPTGKAIYHGSLCKNIIADQFRMKIPDEKLVLAEFENIKRIIK